MALNETQQLRREAFAGALTSTLYPNLRQKDPAAFDSDIQLLYEYMLQPPRRGGDPLHNLNLGQHGKAERQQFDRAAAWITGTRDHPTTLSTELGTGNVQAAAHTLGFNYTRHQLPVPFKGGSPVTGKSSVTLGGIIDHLPGAAKHVGSDVGSGVATGTSDVLGGLGSWFKNNLMLVVLLVVVVLIVKK